MSSDINHLFYSKKWKTDIFIYEYERSDTEFDLNDLERLILSEVGFAEWFCEDNFNLKSLREICEIELNSDPYLTQLWLEQPHFLASIDKSSIIMFCVSEPKKDVKIYNFVFHI